MSNLFDISSLAMIPTAYKDGKLYSVRPIPEYGSEKIINGSFDTDTAWTKGTGWTISGGTASCDGTQTSTTNLNNTLGNGLVNGKIYRVVYTISGYAGGSIRIKLGNTGYGVYHSANGTYTQDLVAGVTTFPTAQFNADANFVGSIDNVSVQEITKSGDFTFSRGTTATRVASSGYIEKGRENLLLQSNTFDTTWFLNRTSATSGQSGYDGSNDAWLLEADVAGSLCNVNQSVSISGVMTASIYAKEGTTNWFRFSVNDSGVNTRAWFDLSGSGAVGTTAGNIIDAKIESVDNGYFRCSITFNATATNLLLFVTNADNSVSYSVGDNIYIQDAQLESGLVSTSVIETTTTSVSAGILEDMPRLDYSGSCPSLLLEPQRTNLVTHSEYFGDSSWSKTSAGGGSNAVVTDNYGVSPEGLQNAARLQLNLNGGTSASDISYIAYYYAATGVATTNSVYMKSLSGTTNVRIRCGSTFESVDVTTDWQRFDVTDSSTSDRFQVLIYGGINSDTADLLIWGAQGEAGSYPTSYIPTYGASVTRNADTTDDLDTSSLLTQSNNNTFFGEVVNHKNLGNTRFIASYDSARSNNDRILIYSSNNSSNYTMHCQYKVSGETTIQFNLKTNVNYGDTIKFAVVFNGTQMIGFANGVKAATATIVDADNFNKFDITDIYNESGVYKQLLLFPTALTDSECIALTTL